MKTFMFCLYSSFLLALGGVLLQGCLWTPERIDIPCPSLTDIIPDGGHFDDTITIKGSRFLKGSPELYVVSIDGKEIPREYVVDVPDENRLRFKVPIDAPCGLVTISIVNMPDCVGGLSKPFTYYYTATNAEIFAGAEGQFTGEDRFYYPQGLDVDNNGNVIVADREHHVVKQINFTDRKVSRIAGTGENNWHEDDGLFAILGTPMDVAFDNLTKKIYVADLDNNVIWKIDPSSTRKTTTISGDHTMAGGSNGTSVKSALFDGPAGIATDSKGILYVTELYGHRLRMLETNQDFAKTILGDIPPSFYPLKSPVGLAYSDKRNINFPIFVADKATHLIRNVGLNGDSLRIPSNLPLGQSIFITPHDVAVDNKGNVYVVDRDQRKIFVIYPNNNYEELKINYNFNKPVGIAFDKDRNFIYVSDELKFVVVQIKIK